MSMRSDPDHQHPLLFEAVIIEQIVIFHIAINGVHWNNLVTMKATETILSFRCAMVWRALPSVWCFAVRGVSLVRFLNELGHHTGVEVLKTRGQGANVTILWVLNPSLPKIRAPNEIWQR